MKTTISTLAGLAIAASAAAHTTPLPHAHHGAESHSLPLIACSAALAIAGVVTMLTRRKAKLVK